MNHAGVDYVIGDACLAKEQIFDLDGRDWGQHTCIWKGRTQINPQHDFHICFCGYTWNWEVTDDRETLDES